MKKVCTVPERWKVLPGPDASEDEVKAYLSHARECVYHAEIENRYLKMTGTIAAIASSTLREGHPILPMEERASVVESPDRMRGRGRRAPIRMLSIRLNGAERSCIDLNHENQVTLEVNDAAFIGVWKPKENGEEEDLHLTTYVLAKTSDISRGKKKSFVTLEDGQRISFEVESKGASRASITVAYREANLLRANPLAHQRVNYGFQAVLRWVNQEGGARPATALILALVVFLLVTTQLPNSKEPGQIAVQGERPQQSEKQAPGLAPAEQSSGQGQQGPTGNTSNLASQKSAQFAQSGARVRRSNSLTANKAATVVLPEQDLKRIYVGSGFDEELRQALNNSLEANGVALVQSEKQAAVVLRAEQTRGEEVIVELIGRSQERLWWMNAKISGDNSISVEDLAKKIVNDLLNKIENLKRRENAKHVR